MEKSGEHLTGAKARSRRNVVQKIRNREIFNLGKIWQPGGIECFCSSSHDVLFVPLRNCV